MVTTIVNPVLRGVAATRFPLGNLFLGSLFTAAEISGLARLLRRVLVFIAVLASSILIVIIQRRNLTVALDQELLANVQLVNIAKVVVLSNFIN